MTKENRNSADFNSTKGKDYSKYFDFTDAKVISEQEGKTTYRIKGRNVQINSQPDYREGKRRGKEEIEVLYHFEIPPEMEDFGQGKTYHITTYGCQLVQKAL
ncbi:hypothetical protein MKX70_20055 [Paenibacillus sp. FSL R7-0312]|uniref:hypothetical protein n=1 Tax=Paenibacillus sp. FSL R7-0312 TaxID=2921682 RepID=UPI0030F8AACF